MKKHIVLSLSLLFMLMFSYGRASADTHQVTLDNNQSYIVNATLNSSSANLNVGAAPSSQTGVQFDNMVSITINGQTVSVGTNGSVMLANGHSVSISWSIQGSGPSQSIIIELQDNPG